MKLNRLQRHTTYIIMLAEIESPSTVLYREENRLTIENGLCWLYKMLFDFEFNYDFGGLLGELNRFEHSVWWSDIPVDWEIRKEALKKCIEETYE